MCFMPFCIQFASIYFFSEYPALQQPLPSVSSLYPSINSFNYYTLPKKTGLYQYNDPIGLQTANLASTLLQQYPIVPSYSYKNGIAPVPYASHLPTYRPTHVTGYNHKSAAILPVPVHHPAYLRFHGRPRPINEKTVAKTLLYSLLLSQVLRLSG